MHTRVVGSKPETPAAFAEIATATGGTTGHLNVRLDADDEAQLSADERATAKREREAAALEIYGLIGKHVLHQLANGDAQTELSLLEVYGKSWGPGCS